MSSRFQIAIIMILSLTGMILSPALGASLPGLDKPHDETLFDLVIEGPVQSINLNVITIADIGIEFDNETLLAGIQVGDVIQVGGSVDQSRNTLVLIAEEVMASNANIITPIISINGPVDAVSLNIVTVYGFDIQFNPDDTILTEINIGDIIAVSGNVGTFGGIIIVVPVQVIIVVNAPDPEATPEAEPDNEYLPITIVIEGPVEAININVITIFNIDVVVEEDDPILTEIVIGDNVRVEGNVSGDDGVIVIIAVNITIIQIDIIVAPPGQGIPAGCKVTKKGKIKCTGRSQRSNRSNRSSRHS